MVALEGDNMAEYLADIHPILPHWSTAAIILRMHHLGSCVVINSHLCIADNHSFRWYDMNSKQWKSLASMHRKRYNFALIYLDGYVYAIGGEWYTQPYIYGRFVHGVHADIERYSVAHDKWEMLPPMPHACKSPSTVALSGKIYVYGQKENSQDEYILQVFTPSSTSADGTWDVILQEKFDGLTDVHKPILTQQNGKVYRVAYGRNENLHYECKVNQLDTETLRFGSNEDQCLDRRVRDFTSQHPITFCIDGRLYANVKGYIYDVGHDAGYGEPLLREVTRPIHRKNVLVAMIIHDPLELLDSAFMVERNIFIRNKNRRAAIALANDEDLDLPLDVEIQFISA